MSTPETPGLREAAEESWRTTRDMELAGYSTAETQRAQADLRVVLDAARPPEPSDPDEREPDGR